MENMVSYTPYLRRLDDEGHLMEQLLKSWVEVGSGSRNLPGLEKMLSMLCEAFTALEARMEIVPLQPQDLVQPDGSLISMPLGRALCVSKRPHAPLRVLLSIHYDTVYGTDHPFRTCELLDANTMRGPGTADAKGGLVVLLKSLEALESTPWAEHLGWEVILGPDEEVGSPGSSSLLADASGRAHLGLIFEPSRSDGTLVGSRKGSGVYSILARGKSAHAGRNPQDGRNAIDALAYFIVELHTLLERRAGVVLNVAHVQGGGPANVVPDLAFCRLNVRTETPEDQQRVDSDIAFTAENIGRERGISMDLHRDSQRPPKALDDRTVKLMDLMTGCGNDLGIPMQWGSSGGASDGNILAAAGLPTLDSLGVRGGNLHSSEEYVLLDSLVERTKLTALFLMKLASGEIGWPPGTD